MSESKRGVEEMYVAYRVRDVSLKSRHRDLGDPRLHDDGTVDSMYDVEFPDADPPVALEVTSLADSRLSSTSGAALKGADRPIVVAAQSNTGRWLIEIGKDLTLKGEAERWILDVVRGKELDFKDDLPEGIVRVHHNPDQCEEVRIGTWASLSVGATPSPIGRGGLEERVRAKRHVFQT